MTIHDAQEANRMNRNTTFRQGDVLVRAIAKMPAGLVDVPLENGRLILAHGEVTGHAHVIEGAASFLAADLADLDRRFLRVEAEAKLVHDEHETITIPPGDYEVIRQREYTSADMAPMRVGD